MKFVTSLLFTLFFLEPVASESNLYLDILTILNGKGLPASQVQSVASTMVAEKTKLDGEVSQVAHVYKSSFVTTETYSTTSDNSYLRARELQSGCNPCPGFPTGYMCWYNGVRRPACRRELEMHKDLDESELSELSEDDRQRHLQASQMCADAKADVVKVIKADIAAGVITAPYAAFSFECVYEVA